jgi:hypothetical protein
MSRSWVANDLRYAQAAGVYAEVALSTGETLLVRVLEVNEQEGLVSVAVPQISGDETPSREIRLDVMSSVKVTEIETHPNAAG